MQPTPIQPHRPVIGPNPTSATTPTSPSTSPAARHGPRRSWTPKKRELRTTVRGTIAIRMAVTEEPIHCSPREMAEKGMTNSTTAKAQIGTR